MNPSINIDAQKTRVGPETESYYTDAFFEDLTGVANALDNIDASEWFLLKTVTFALLLSPVARPVHLSMAGIDFRISGEPEPFNRSTPYLTKGDLYVGHVTPMPNVKSIALRRPAGGTPDISPKMFLRFHFIIKATRNTLWQMTRHVSRMCL